MTLFRNRYRIESTRLKGWDYANAGWYFLTTVTKNRACLFGDVINGEMVLNPLGQIVQSCWDDLPNHYPTMVPDAFVIMPNHVHMVIGLIDINDASVETGLRPVSTDAWGTLTNTSTITSTQMDARTNTSTSFTSTLESTIITPNVHLIQSHVPKRVPVSEIIRAFKSFSSRRINALRGTPGTPIWQTRYHDRIVRDHEALNSIRRYIALNPAKWPDDRNHDPQKEWAQGGFDYEH